jgi:poly-gamma-glutamate synthesis protein (capsule biosynthesis protein)
MASYEAVVFDFGGVLTDGYSEATYHLEISEKFGVDVDRLMPFLKANKFLSNLLVGTETEENVVRAVGFDVLSQANNHSRDQGRVGADESRRAIRDAGMQVFGDEVREDDTSFVTTTVRGRQIAIVGFNETSDRIDDADAAEVLRQANLAADTVIAFMHWGEEYRNRPTRSQESRAKWLIDRGVDLVIGAHPHWVQGISSYRGKPIVYSLGNFVFDQDWSEETRRGLTLGVRIADTGIAIDLYPVQIDSSQPVFVEGEERAARLRDLASVSDASLMSQIVNGELFFPTP